MILKRLILPLLATGTLLTSAAYASELPIGQGEDSFDNVDTVSDDMLDDMRGGFRGSNAVMIDFSFLSRVRVQNTEFGIDEISEVSINSQDINRMVNERVNEALNKNPITANNQPNNNTVSVTTGTGGVSNTTNTTPTVDTGNLDVNTTQNTPATNTSVTAPVQIASDVNNAAAKQVTNFIAPVVIQNSLSNSLISVDRSLDITVRGALNNAMFNARISALEAQNIGQLR